ncbi:MAG: hypothetical protein LUQ37_09035 [Methanoregulaceae archaeon]|jgi:hypothetical protein|nr:hypothetical protein [Methanoregulaceae archaeon]
MSDENPQTDATAEEPQTELFDLLIPPGVPSKLIIEIAKKFDVEVVERKERLYFANMEGDERILLAFRGNRENLELAHTYLVEKLKEFIGE